MTQLPVAIEQYLLECGFTSTEILILKHLLAGGSMTLRELAAKTGKSTGVLDSASKKLLKKGILGKEIVNETPKLTLSSLEAVVAWVHEDSEHKRASMERREKDLQAFVDSLSTNVSRADIQHFEGTDGMEQAYSKLLEVCGGAMLHFLPVRSTEVEDPLRDFLVQFFRIRRRNGVITRVIAHDTPLGRRYQSRDPFEFRQTLLVPEEVYAFNTEKVVAGDWVGTLNHRDQKAFIIRSKEMAHTERAMFEALWKQEMAKQKANAESTAVVLVPKEEELKIKMISAAREFFLSRRSLLAFLLFGIFAASITLIFYQYIYSINTQRLRERAMGIAATAALQFEAADIEKIHTYKDVTKPEYLKITDNLQAIREQNQGIEFAYILRPTPDIYYWEFVADADSQILLPQVDLNGDGILSDQIPPGYLWLDEDPKNSAVRLGIVQSTADKQAVVDPWGIWISGHAPIKNNEGETVGVLGVDYNAKDIEMLNRQSFTPLYIFLGVFIFLVLIRFAANNRSLLKEVFALSQTRTFILGILILLLTFVVSSYGIYLYTVNIIKEQTAERLRAIAATTALQIDYHDLQSLNHAKDMEKEEYQRVFEILNNVKQQNPDVKWAFVLRPTNEKEIWEFVVDADANYFVPSGVDDNQDGVVSEFEENVYPGFKYDVSEDPVIRSALKGPVAAKVFHSDQWGTYISGFAPIYESENKPIAIVGFDIIVSDVLSRAQINFFQSIFVILIPFLGFVITKKNLLKIH